MAQGFQPRPAIPSTVAVHRSLSLAPVLVLAVLATPVAAEERSFTCRVDVGAPFLLVDTGEREVGRYAVGGCQLLHDLEEPHEIISIEPGDWPVTPFTQDCAIQLDADGDGSGFEPVGAGDEVPPGADLWAKCETGERLDNRVTIAPI